MPDGEYRLGSQHVTKCLGGVRLADGTLAGSTLTMDQALRNLVSIGLPIADVSNRLSRFAADYLGIEDRGRLARGAWADLRRVRSRTGTDRDIRRRRSHCSNMLKEALSSAEAVAAQLADTSRVEAWPRSSPNSRATSR